MPFSVRSSCPAQGPQGRTRRPWRIWFPGLKKIWGKRGETSWAKDRIATNLCKTVEIVFTRQVGDDEFIKAGRSTTEYHRWVKYLGVVFLDKKLYWIEHLANKCKKLIAYLWLCKSSIGKNRGLLNRIHRYGSTQRSCYAS